ncbi:LuxR C-terminal-related transcriptional regulator [Microbacter margulisiae]|uniref:DNA-binding CsgD family transcriptional regulator n=1 Tax=Microbacter margulisiae TaxID=1350067 RepID=A0A7W5DV35_9PORP|nr:LuxR C-terminal-related transcriptional regulator [Microbacter margulisiae]MBB3188743.1 DNA-binding CsgD family transcriptional regulator [Microbacter margulisiae]
MPTIREEHAAMISNHVCKVKESDYALILQDVLTLTILESVNCMTAIFDLHRGNYRHIDPQFQKLLGHPFPVKAGYESNVSFYDLVHPDDVTKLQEADIQAYDRFHEIAADKRHHYCMNCDFRIRTASGDYIRIHRNMSPLTYDREGKLWLVYLQFGCMRYKTDKHPISAWLLDKKTLRMESLMKGWMSAFKKKIISKRVLEVLILTREGLTVEQIAKELSLSVTTVYNYRRLAMRELGLQTIDQVNHYLGLAGIMKLVAQFIISLFMYGFAT